MPDADRLTLLFFDSGCEGLLYQIAQFKKEARWMSSHTKRIHQSNLVRKDVAEFDFQLVQQGLQLIERNVTFPQFEPVKHGVRDAGFFGELGIRHFSPRFSQVFR